MTAQHSSASVEHYTPKYVVNAARKTLGAIDLDPATTKHANAVVKAKRIFTREDNGLGRDWAGRVLLNPPGGLVDGSGCPVIRRTKLRRPCIETGECGLAPGHKHEGVTSSSVFWWCKLEREFRYEHVSSAIFIGFSIEILQTAQNSRAVLIPSEFPLCVPKNRIPFDIIKNGGRVSGSQPTHANVIVCLTDDVKIEERFYVAFSEIGTIFNMG